MYMQTAFSHAVNYDVGWLTPVRNIDVIFPLYRWVDPDKDAKVG